MAQMTLEEFQQMSDYELCALYCDYHEWLFSPATRPTDAAVIGTYKYYLEEILQTIAARHKD